MTRRNDIHPHEHPVACAVSYGSRHDKRWGDQETTHAAAGIGQRQATDRTSAVHPVADAREAEPSRRSGYPPAETPAGAIAASVSIPDNEPMLAKRPAIKQFGSAILSVDLRFVPVTGLAALVGGSAASTRLGRLFVGRNDR